MRNLIFKFAFVLFYLLLLSDSALTLNANKYCHVKSAFSGNEDRDLPEVGKKMMLCADNDPEVNVTSAIPWNESKMHINL